MTETLKGDEDADLNKVINLPIQVADEANLQMSILRYSSTSQFTAETMMWSC